MMLKGLYRRALLAALVGIAALAGGSLAGSAGAADPCAQPGVITGSGTINGTPGNDVICGSDDADTISGMGGDDVIYGQGGDDTIRGGAGNDELHGGRDNDL